MHRKQPSLFLIYHFQPLLTDGYRMILWALVFSHLIFTNTSSSSFSHNWIFVFEHNPLNFADAKICGILQVASRFLTM